MEDLRELVAIIRDLPNFALAILAGYLIYKLAVVGSIYGVVRFAIGKLYDWKTHPPYPAPKPPPVDYKLGNITINEAVALGLQAQVARLATSSGYIHADGIAKLREALDAKLGPAERD